MPRHKIGCVASDCETKIAGLMVRPRIVKNHPAQVVLVNSHDYHLRSIGPIGVGTINSFINQLLCPVTSNHD